MKYISKENLTYFYTKLWNRIKSFISPIQTDIEDIKTSINSLKETPLSRYEATYSAEEDKVIVDWGVLDLTTLKPGSMFILKAMNDIPMANQNYGGAMELKTGEYNAIRLSYTTLLGTKTTDASNKIAQKNFFATAGQEIMVFLTSTDGSKDDNGVYYTIKGEVIGALPILTGALPISPENMYICTSDDWFDFDNPNEPGTYFIKNSGNVENSPEIYNTSKNDPKVDLIKTSDFSWIEYYTDTISDSDKIKLVYLMRACRVADDGYTQVWSDWMDLTAIGGSSDSNIKLEGKVNNLLVSSFDTNDVTTYRDVYRHSDNTSDEMQFKTDGKIYMVHQDSEGNRTSTWGLDTKRIMKDNLGIVPDMEYNALRALQPGEYLIYNGTTQNSPVAAHGNLLVNGKPSDRVWALAAYDNGSVFMLKGFSGNSSWVRIDNSNVAATAISGTLPISHGGTGNTHGVFTTLANNPITAIANDTVAQWMTKETGVYWFNTRGLLNGQPGQYGYLLHIAGNGSNCINQFWLSPGSNRLYYRGTNGATNSNGAMTSFSSIRNMTDVVPVAQGGTGTTSIRAATQAQWKTSNPSGRAYVPVFGSNWDSRGYVSFAQLRSDIGITTGTQVYSSDTCAWVKIGNVGICSCLAATVSVPSNTVKSVTVNYPFTFTNSPEVVIGPTSDSAASTYGWTTSAVALRYANRCVIKHFNGDTSSARDFTTRIMCIGTV